MTHSVAPDVSGSPSSRVSRRSLSRMRDVAESKKTVHIAIAANGVIALSKLIGGLASGSTAMLAEAAHSVADTTNQVFLLASIHLGQREPRPDRPFGHGQERFLWTFMAAIGMFLAGAVFAIGYGVYELADTGAEQGGYAIAYVVLALSFAAEGASWFRAFRQNRREAREAGMPLLPYVRQSRDPNVKMVLFEDTAALLGVFLATLGVGLHQANGASSWDAGGSILIGLLLVGVAYWMGHDSKHLLVGASARPDEQDAIERVIEAHDEVVEVVQLLTMVLGPNALMVAARVDLRDGLGSTRVEQLSSEIDRELSEAVPDVTEVFLDATPGRGRQLRSRRGRDLFAPGDHPSEWRTRQT